MHHLKRSWSSPRCTWLARRWSHLSLDAKWAVGALALLALAVSWWRQAHTEVWLVNGQAAPYVVSVAGKDYLLAPGKPFPIVHSGGEVSAAVGSKFPVRCDFERSFMARLIERTT